jgi:hypothetical protein
MIIMGDFKTLFCFENSHLHLREYLWNSWTIWACPLRTVCQPWPRACSLNYMSIHSLSFWYLQCLNCVTLHKIRPACFYKYVSSIIIWKPLHYSGQRNISVAYTKEARFKITLLHLLYETTFFHHLKFGCEILYGSAANLSSYPVAIGS